MHFSPLVSGGTPWGQLIERFWSDCSWELHFAFTAGEGEIWHWIDRFQLIYREICICHSAAKQLLALAAMIMPRCSLYPRPWYHVRCFSLSIRRRSGLFEHLSGLSPTVHPTPPLLTLSGIIPLWICVNWTFAETNCYAPADICWIDNAAFSKTKSQLQSSVQFGSVMKAAETATNICVSFVVFSVCCATN